MATASVAYENSAEARRKLKAIKPLRWHRTSGGALTAQGTRGSYHLSQRSPDRRRGIFPWALRQGGARGVEAKPGGFDTAAEAKDYARLFDAGLCGAPPSVIVQAAPGMPAGTYRGTLANETPGGVPYTAYTKKVEKELAKMGSPSPQEDVTKGAAYIAQMERAGVDPETTAAVVYATMHHAHMHDCAGKHVEMHEAGEARRRRGTPPIFQTLQQRLDAGGYPTVNWPPFHIYYIDSTGKMTDKYQNGPDAAGALRNFRLEGHQERVGEIANVMFTSDGPRDGGEVHTVDANDNLSSSSGAEEAKKRLWQPDPATGLYITHSSYTRNYFLMRGDELIDIKDTRPEIETVARKMTEDMRSPKGASEGRRPKG